MIIGFQARSGRNWVYKSDGGVDFNVEVCARGWWISALWFGRVLVGQSRRESFREVGCWRLLAFGREDLVRVAGEGAKVIGISARLALAFVRTSGYLFLLLLDFLILIIFYVRWLYPAFVPVRSFC
jgi:hypothetical protein